MADIIDGREESKKDKAIDMAEIMVWRVESKKLKQDSHGWYVVKRWWEENQNKKEKEKNGWNEMQERKIGIVKTLVGGKKVSKKERRIVVFMMMMRAESKKETQNYCSGWYDSGQRRN